ncbi:LysR family transcriptional regulator [Jannaschia ovalis]|uniref:LysR family transcriptional regulator n=1 Tax=Jannaschia ovalis TaxID=3038773 RepID=A0ABY8LBN3_9RHOB|nr:LysR family transcriptional regulator [Jannaschia sp. GRR-S6-38]WGH77593.1 LysR family transcriptional regulator [Jannaschia sp. GRR-S6-38]
MDETAGNWDDLRLVLAVARAGGLSPAASATGRSPATLGRRIRAFERRIGQELFLRHDRGYELTAEGEAFLARLAPLDAQIDALMRPARQEAAPLVKISAGTWTTLALLDRVADIAGDPPALRLRFVSDEVPRDLPHREIAIGIRNARPTEPTLAGRRLARVGFAPYARPDAPADWIVTRGAAPSSRWLLARAGAGAALEVTAPRNALDLALAGRGMALLPTFLGDGVPGLVRRGPEIDELAHDRWLVSHQDDRYLPEIRRALERIAAILGS